MLARRTLFPLLTAYFALSAISAWAANPVSWQVSLSTTGQDVFWNSPTAVTPGYPEYDWSFEITEAMAYLSPFGSYNLLDELEATSGSGTTAGLPVVLLEENISEPTTGSSANISIGVDAGGIGRGSATNIVLGEVAFFRIRQVDLKATIEVIGIPTGDFNRNGSVELADFALWKSSFGSTSSLAADGNGNGVVDAGDYTLWRDNFGSGGGAMGVEATGVPEPSLGWLSCAMGLRIATCRTFRKKSVRNS